MAITVTRLNPDEVLRYMGCPPEKADGLLRGQVERCAQELLEVIRPRWSWRAADLALEEAGVRLEGGLLLPGRDLKAHLSGCSRGAVFCATLGAEADALIRRTERLDMAKALTLDCCASAAVEEVCDQIERELQGHFPGCSFPFRYSPGYGDLPLEVQGPLLDLLDAPPGGAVRHGQPPAYPPEVGHRHPGDRRRTNRTNEAQLSGLSGSERLSIPKGGRTLWNFVNC